MHVSATLHWRMRWQRDAGRWTSADEAMIAGFELIACRWLGCGSPSGPRHVPLAALLSVYIAMNAGQAAGATDFAAQSIVPAGRIWWPGNVLQYLPRHARQLGDVHRDQECLVAHEQFYARSAAGLILAIDIGRRLFIVILHDEAGGAFLDRSGRREAEGTGQSGSRAN
jgi:hypothetical protein